MVKVTLSISDQHAEKFLKLANSMGIGRSDLLRRMIEEYAEKLKIEK